MAQKRRAGEPPPARDNDDGALHNLGPAGAGVKGRLWVRDWRRFQHYRDRRPPWIKLHRELLDDYEFSRLPFASKAIAPWTWLLASETWDGSVPADPGEVAWRLHMSKEVIQEGLLGLVQAGFLLTEPPASDSLAPASPETERETEGEGEPENGSSEGKEELCSRKACEEEVCGSDPDDGPVCEEHAVEAMRRRAREREDRDVGDGPGWGGA